METIEFNNKWEKYKDDDDFKDMGNLSIDKKKIVLDKYSLFLAKLFSYKNQITIKLIEG